MVDSSSCSTNEPLLPEDHDDRTPFLSAEQAPSSSSQTNISESSASLSASKKDAFSSDFEDIIEVVTSHDANDTEEDFFLNDKSLINRPEVAENSVKSKALYTIDVLLSAFFFAFLSALYWYGTWTFLDVFVLPENNVLSSAICYVASLLMILPGYIFQQDIQNIYNNCHFAVQFVMRYLYVYLMSLAYVLEWRGCWELCDKYIELDWKGELSIAIIAITYMLIARSFRLVTSSPYLLSYDDWQDFFVSQSRYKIDALKSAYVQHSIDFLIAELVESFASIISWRGILIVFDWFIYPNDSFMSIVVSAAIGYAIYFIIVSVQFIVYGKISKYSLVPRLLFEDITILAMFISSILLWKAYWMLLDTYVYSEKYALLIFAIFHFSSFILAIAFNASAVIAGTGIDLKDGEIIEERCFFRIAYVSTIFQTSDVVEEQRVKNRRHYIIQ